MNKKVVIVGNGSSVLDRKMGKVIDSYDIVVRFNRYKTEGFEEYVGSKTDIWFISDLKVPMIKDKDLTNMLNVYVYTPKFKWNPNLLDNIKSDKVKQLSPAIEEDVNNVVDFSPLWPTTGVIGVWVMSRLYGSASIYGFDSFDPKYQYTHYFDQGIPGRETKIIHEQKKGHSIEKEKLFFEYCNGYWNNLRYV